MASPAERLEAKTSTPEEGSAICFHLTGFGPFGGVEHNPSSLIVPRLAEHWAANAPVRSPPYNRVRFGHAAVCEVSTAGVDEEVAAVRRAVCGYGGDDDCRHVWLHFGVAAGSAGFALERAAYNEASFRIPDQRGAQPAGAAIDGDEPCGTRHNTTLPVAALVDFLRARELPFVSSENPGRFLCNWMYFRSACATEELNAAVAGASRGAPRHQSLFCHVPSLEACNLDTQLALATELVSALALVVHLGNDSFLRRFSQPSARRARAAGGDGDDGEEDGGDGEEVDDEDDAADHAARAEQQRLLDAKDGVVVDASPSPEPSPQLQLPAALAAASGATSPAAPQLLSLSNFDLGALAAAAPPAAASGAKPTRALIPVAAGAGGGGGFDVKLVIAVRVDLGMGAGKVAAQCCHAALKAVARVAATATGAALVARWRGAGERIVVVRCDDLPHLEVLRETAAAVGLPACSICDAGRTQVDAGTTTVLAVGPAAADDVDCITGALRLL